MKYSDILIIGGGASGIMCAIRAKEKNPRLSVTLLEKQNRIGRKILSTGNGRCNLLNAYADKTAFQGSFVSEMDCLLSKNSPDRMAEYFKKIGLLIKQEGDGRLYPVSNHASSVLDVLRFRLDSLGVEVVTEEAVKSINKNGKAFQVNTENNSFNAKKLVVATGSLASPKLGGDNSGISALKNLGLKVVPSYPALCPVNVKSNILKSLKGLRVQGEASLFDGNKLIDTEKGEIQFTENALSGICVFNLSNSLNNVKNPIIRLNLLPNDNPYKLVEKNAKLFSNREAEDLFTGIFQKKLALALLKEAELSPSKHIGKLSRDETKRLSALIGNWAFKLIGAEGYNKAQVAGGGVHANEINPETLETRIKNLYVCGEAIDIIGKCGGYNLYFAFASGKTVGESI